MKLLRKVVCILLICGMLTGITGCGTGGNITGEKEPNNNMILVDTKWLDETEYYFIDGNLEVQKYIGYYSMEDFEDGISMVEVYSPEFQGYQLIDAAEKVVVQYARIEKKRVMDNVFYMVMDENEKKGVLNSKGEVVAECKYDDVYILDDNQSHWEDIIFCKMEDTAVDIFDKNGTFLCHIPAGYVTADYGYRGVSFSNVDNVLMVEYGNEVIEVVVEEEKSQKPYEDAAAFRNSEYWLREDETTNMLVNAQGETVFSVPADTEIVASMCDEIFFTKKENEVKIYWMDTLKEYDGITYRSNSSSGTLFYGEENIIINENGKSCKVSGIDGVAYNGIGFLDDGYVYVNTGNKYVIVDVEGKGTMVEAPYSIQFSSLIPCYQYEGIYYDFDGNVIIDTKQN